MLISKRSTGMTGGRSLQAAGEVRGRVRAAREAQQSALDKRISEARADQQAQLDKRIAQARAGGIPKRGSLGGKSRPVSIRAVPAQDVSPASPMLAANAPRAPVDLVTGRQAFQAGFTATKFSSPFQAAPRR